MQVKGRPLLTPLPDLLHAKDQKRGPRGEKKVNISTDSSTKILKLSHGDLLKLAKRLEMALGSGSGAASSEDIETNIDNDDTEDVGELRT